MELETGSRSARGQEVGTAEIPVALTTNPDSADAVATAEIPVAVNNTGTQRGRRKGKSPRALAGATIIPIAVNARVSSARSRAERRRRAQHPMRQKSAPHKAKAADVNPAMEPADLFTRGALAVTRFEEDAVKIAGQLSLAAIDTFEAMARFVFRMPNLADRAVRESSLPWKAPEIRRSAERARESLAAVLPFAA